MEKDQREGKQREIGRKIEQRRDDGWKGEEEKYNSEVL